MHVDQICLLAGSLCGVNDEAGPACANNICICSLQCEPTTKVGTADESERSVLFPDFGEGHEGPVDRAFRHREVWVVMTVMWRDSPRKRTHLVFGWCVGSLLGPFLFQWMMTQYGTRCQMAGLEIWKNPLYIPWAGSPSRAWLAPQSHNWTVPVRVQLPSATLSYHQKFRSPMVHLPPFKWVKYGQKGRKLYYMQLN